MADLRDEAATLLAAIWRGIPLDYKSRYRTTIWQQFENNIRAAAYTSNLPKFLNSICTKLQAQIKAADSTTVEAILNGGNDRALLKLLREETTLLVLMIRVANQERHERWKAAQAERQAEETAATEPDFGLPDDDFWEETLEGG